MDVLNAREAVLVTHRRHDVAHEFRLVAVFHKLREVCREQSDALVVEEVASGKRRGAESPQLLLVHAPRHGKRYDLISNDLRADGVHAPNTYAEILVVALRPAFRVEQVNPTDAIRPIRLRGHAHERLLRHRLVRLEAQAIRQRDVKGLAPAFGVGNRHPHVHAVIVGRAPKIRVLSPTIKVEATGGVPKARYRLVGERVG